MTEDLLKAQIREAEARGERRARDQQLRESVDGLRQTMTEMHGEVISRLDATDAQAREHIGHHAIVDRRLEDVEEWRLEVDRSFRISEMNPKQRGAFLEMVDWWLGRKKGFARVVATVALASPAIAAVAAVAVFVFDLLSHKP